MNFAMTVFALALSPAPAHELVTDLPNGFLPEGVEWDAAHSRFLVSSVREHRIASVDPVNGRASAFGEGPGSVLGLHVDPNAHIVWAAWTQFGHAFKTNKATGISAWSTDNGHRIGNWPLPDNDPRVNFGDFTQLDSRTLIASDSGTGAIWRFDMKTHRYTNVVPAGKFKSPQGLVPGRKAGTIYLADYPTGLWRVAVKDGNATPLTAPAGVEMRGLDGLYRHGDYLIAVQNGTKTPRILAIRFGNDDSIVDVRHWLEMPGAELDLGTLTRDTFWFVANGQWDEYDDDLAPRPGVKLQAPRLRALPLSDLAQDR